MGGVVMFTRRSDELVQLPRLPFLLLLLAFLPPWLSVGYTKQSDIWLFAVMGLLSLLLIVSRFLEMDEEAWLKAGFSWIFGGLMLLVSLHPVLGLPFPVSTEVARSISVSTGVTAIFLWFGLPPLQQGSIDIGSIKSIRWQLMTNSILRFVLCFIVLAFIQMTPWMESLEEYHVILIVALFLGVSASRLILRLQTNLFRLLSYLGSSYVLAVISAFVFVDYTAPILLALALAQIPFYTILNYVANSSSESSDLWNLSYFFQFHPAEAKKWTQWLKVYLTAEVFLITAMGVNFVLLKSYALAVFSALAAICTLSVLADKEAFKPWLNSKS